MKKIDLLLIRSFIPPLIIWFLVAVFIFNMQFLWKYIDDIVGKGLEISIILELLFYQAVAMVPRALVFGILIASVMTMGNLAEHYELVSMKSAGVSLFRIIRPLFLFSVLLCICSLIFSNIIIPGAALQFKSRLHDIRKQKPALVLEKGQFNTDFKNIIIYIGDKDAESKNLWDIKLYDHSKGMGNVSQTNAERGRLYYSKDKRYLIMKLYNGQRYEYMNPIKGRPKAFPHLRVGFREFTAMFDMKQFEQTETDQNIFRKHHSLLSINQLTNAMDSLHEKKAKKVADFQKNLDNFYHFRRTGVDSVISDSTLPKAFAIEGLPEAQPPIPIRFANVLDPNKQKYVIRRAAGHVSNAKTQAKNTFRSFSSVAQSLAEHENEVHQKLLYAVACILFLFIGAPMGALIRKGGFGWPVLVSIVLFMAFFVLNLIGDRLAKNLITEAWFGAWLPMLVLFPLSMWLTYRAMNDASGISIKGISTFFSNIGSKLHFWKRRKS